MIEKQQPFKQDHGLRAEEENKSHISDFTWDKKELEKETDIAKMLHKEATQHDNNKLKSHINEDPSTKTSREAVVCSETQPSVIQLAENVDWFQDKSQNKPSQTTGPEANNNVAPGSRQIKEKMGSKPRKKRRRQSLNLGLPAELVSRKPGSCSSGEENEDSDSDNTSDKMYKRGNHCDSSPMDDQGLGKDWFVSVYKDNQKVDLPVWEGKVATSQEGEQVKKNGNQVVMTSIELGSLNGPARIENESSFSTVKSEFVVKLRGKGLIDNKELAEVKLRQVRTHERKVSSSGGEDIEGLFGDRVQRTSLHRLSGSSFQSEITRIVPLKPERSKSVAVKDDREEPRQEEPTRVIKREYRWSVGSPEGSSDLNWTDVSTFHSAAPAELQSLTKTEHPDDSSGYGRCCTENQQFSTKISALPKMTPPAPPVKTQKARESGLILRNSRNVGREYSLDTAKKRHSVTLLGICYSVIGNKA